MGYKVNPTTGELSEYIFEIGGILALRNFNARTIGERLVIQSAENANFTILDALVSEVEIDGVVYDNPKSAQEALQRLVFNPNVPVLLTEQQKLLILGALQRGEYIGTAKDLSDAINNVKNKQVKSFTITGDVNKIAKITFMDGTSIQAEFTDNDTQTTADVMLNSLNFNESTGVLTGVRSDGTQITVDLNGRYSLLGHKHSWNEIEEKPTLITQQDIDNSVANKVDKVPGKQLSTNDFTNELKQKLEGLSDVSGGSNVQSDWNEVDTSSDSFIKNKPNITEMLDGKVDKEVGKGLSSNDFTSELKSKLQSLKQINYSNLATTEEIQSIETKIENLKQLLTDSANLDNLKEIVNFIKINKDTLNALSISSIAGLTEALAGKSDSNHKHVIADITDFPKNLITFDHVEEIGRAFQGIQISLEDLRSKVNALTNANINADTPNIVELPEPYIKMIVNTKHNSVNIKVYQDEDNMIYEDCFVDIRDYNIKKQHTYFQNYSALPVYSGYEKFLTDDYYSRGQHELSIKAKSFEIDLYDIYIRGHYFLQNSRLLFFTKTGRVKIMDLRKAYENARIVDYD